MVVTPGVTTLSLKHALIMYWPSALTRWNSVFSVSVRVLAHCTAALPRTQGARDISPEASREAAVEKLRQPAARPGDAADVDPDRPGVARLQELDQERPLLLLELAVVEPFVEVLGVGAADIVAAHRCALVDEDQHREDGRPRIHRDHGLEERIGIVLLTQDQPDIEAGSMHRTRKDRVEAFADHFGDQRRLLPRGQYLGLAPR